MKRKHLTALIPSVILVAIVMFVSCVGKTEAPKQLIKDVNTQEASSLIEENKNNANFIIIDVRTPQEYTGGHIQNAINIDFNSGAFRDTISSLDRTKKYLVYCRSGNRSRGAVNEMAELGFEQIYHLYAGIIGWSDAGYPVVK